MNYLGVAENIYQWLAKYQINQRQIVSHYNEKIQELSFNLQHPVEGEKKVKMPVPDNKFFRTHGIGLKMNQEENDRCLLDVYDNGGIFDPVDSYVPGDHYAATHFALLGAIIYNIKKNPNILNQVKKAIEFHISTLKDEYYFGKWGYHWDFKNIAFLETYRQLREIFSEEERNYWIHGIRLSKENSQNPLTNWMAMRTYAALLRYKLLNSKSDKLKFHWRLYGLNKMQHSDGCYDDYWNKSRPIQYHVFTLALLHRIFLSYPNARIKASFLAGVKYFVKFIDPDGCFNYLGRGQEQIFGYAVGLYVLEAAKLLDDSRVDYYQLKLDSIWNYLLSFQRDGYFPLVLNTHDVKEKFGWYDYHHLTVYNAFLGVWLGLTHSLKQNNSIDKNKKLHCGNHFVQYFEPTKNVIISKEEYFAVFSGGTPEYLSEPCVTPIHLWFKEVGWIFSCPGGPSPEKYGKINFVENVDKNFFAPMINQNNLAWDLPVYLRCIEFNANSESLSIIFDYGIVICKRRVLFNNRCLIFEDFFRYKKDGSINELRYFNFPVVIDKFEIEFEQQNKMRLISDNGIIQIKIMDTDFGFNNFDKAEKIKTAKGMAHVVTLKKCSIKVERGKTNFIRFSIDRLL
jgi:hypothetical protein